MDKRRGSLNGHGPTIRMCNDFLSVADGIPVLVGITGHRALRDEDRPILIARTKEALGDVRACLPHTPVILLSPLAEGADRLAAEVALEMGIRVVAPLPMAPEEYARDFADPDAFFALLAQPGVRAHVVEGVSAFDPSTRDGRDRCYERVGAHVARHAQILLALWDGEDSAPGAPGSGQTVRFMLEGIPVHLPPEGRSPLDEPESFAVVQVFSPRQGATIPQESTIQPGDVQVLRCMDDRQRAGSDVYLLKNRVSLRKTIVGNDEGDDDDGNALRHQNRLNADLASIPANSAALSVTGVARLLGKDVDANGLPADVRSMAAVYAAADDLALRYQAPTHRTLAALFIASTLGFVAFATYTELYRSWIPLAVYMGVVVGLVWLWIAQPGNVEKDRYQDYRALAEGLRVQFYWNLAGIQECVADSYLASYRSELDWIRDTLRSLWYAVGQLGTPTSSPAQVELAATRWIGFQLGYFEKGSSKRAIHVMRAERLKKALAVIGVLLLVPLPFFHMWEYEGLAFHSVVFLSGVLSALGAAYVGYTEMRAFDQERREFEQLRKAFTRAQDHVARAHASGDMNEVRGLMILLGREALAKNADWTVIHRQKYMDPPWSV